MTSRGDEDDNIESVAHLPYLDPLPTDAQRMGLDRNTEEGAMIGMAGSLNSGKTSHRLGAWVLIAALGLPVLYTVVAEIF
jgi:hypothetical protein